VVSSKAEPGVRSRSFLAITLVAFLTLVPVGQASSEPTERPRVVLAQGALVGTAEAEVEYFRGIPFAAPPVGDLRWMPPGDAPSWTGERDATSYGPMCRQVPISLIKLPQNEDCLSLNVARPAHASNAPVMVWLHGGGNLGGSGIWPIFNGPAFPKHGIILVTVNYRLGNFGFFAHPAITAAAGSAPAANFGLLDQSAALRWVQANIAAFGGDPRNVTIIGESAGASDILALLSLPTARTLFSAAIIESANVANLNTLASAEADGVRAGIELGLGTNPTLSALRAVPAEKLISVGAMAHPQPGFGPVVDGVVLKESPLQALREHGLPVPLIIGVNSDEGVLMSALGLSAQQTIEWLAGDAAGLRDAYKAIGNDPSSYARSLFRDVRFSAPARAIAATGTSAVPAWLYRFDYVPSAERSASKGAPHAGEVPYVFEDFENSLGLGPKGKVTDADRTVAAGINSCWVAFAKRRDPARATYCKQWRPFHRTAMWLVFDDKPTIKIGLDKAQLDAVDKQSSTASANHDVAETRPVSGER